MLKAASYHAREGVNVSQSLPLFESETCLRAGKHCSDSYADKALAKGVIFKFQGVWKLV